ncbi:hypothetical protein [Candidatus Karelsulcia muelleri]
MVSKRYILNTNSEFVFYKLLSNSSFYNKNLLSDIWRIYSHNYNNKLLVKKTKHIIVNKQHNIFNALLFIQLINNLLPIQYISERGFLYIDPRNKSFLPYHKVNIYSSKGRILPGLIRPKTNETLQIDIGVENRHEVYALGINYNALIGLQDSLSIINNKYLVSHHISSQIGIFMLIEIISYFKSHKHINFILYKNLTHKILMLNKKIQIIILLNRSQQVGMMLINKYHLESTLLYCYQHNIICYINHLKINTYFITFNVKYLNTPNEMIKKQDIENLIQFVIWIFTRCDN